MKARDAPADDPPSRPLIHMGVAKRGGALALHRDQFDGIIDQPIGPVLLGAPLKYLDLAARSDGQGERRNRRVEQPIDIVVKAGGDPFIVAALLGC